MNTTLQSHPNRIVCLSAETTETLYLLGEQQRIVGISGFTARPAAARREKRRVPGVTSARLKCIRDLQPDLVLGFSGLQAEVVAAIANEGIAIHLFNQRTVSGILDMIRMLGGMIGCDTKAADLAARLEWRVEAIRAEASRHERRPRIYFEEWDEPQISATGWVSELISIAGADDCFADLAEAPLATNRRVVDPHEVIRRAPDMIVGSWCGKKFRPERILARSGWEQIPAVRDGELHEIKSSLILPPGPVALTEGLDRLQGLVRHWRDAQRSRERSPATHRRTADVGRGAPAGLTQGA
ncbi:MAG TPA: ABC transporter substrate-binding protein [Steroidobacteraceae bacterium]